MLFRSGFLSDRIGILKVLLVIFILQGLVFLAFPFYVLNLSAMLMASVILGLGIGASLALYPVLTSECFGVEHLGINYGLVFTAYGFGALAIQGGALLRDALGSYTVSLLIAGVMSLSSAFIISQMKRVYKLA